MKYKFVKTEIKPVLRSAILLVIWCFLFNACVSIKPVYYDEDKKVAEKQVEKFHQLFNEEKYDEIYNMFTEKEQNQQSKEQFVTALKNILAIQGKVKNSKLVKSEVKPKASFRVVHMFYETEFEKGKQLEEFDWLVDGNDALVDFYGHPTQLPVNEK